MSRIVDLMGSAVVLDLIPVEPRASIGPSALEDAARAFAVVG